MHDDEVMPAIRFELISDWCQSEIHDDYEEPTFCVLVGAVPVCGVCIVDYFEGWDTALATARWAREWLRDRDAAVAETERVIENAALNRLWDEGDG